MEDPIPLPSRTHYELLLQLLERKTLRATDVEPVIQDKIQDLIVTLRKAFAQQKQIEAICQQKCLAVEHHWSMHSPAEDAGDRTDLTDLNAPT